MVSDNGRGWESTTIRWLQFSLLNPRQNDWPFHYMTCNNVYCDYVSMYDAGAHCVRQLV